jgi:hypothetical protein
MTNENVVWCWIKGESGKAGNLSTDGTSLYSYRLKIAERKDGLNRVYDYTSSGIYKSQTTSCHVGLALRLAGHSFLDLPPSY